MYLKGDLQIFMIYVTSDLHGYPLQSFKDALCRAGFSKNDHCFILGDVIDRGEEGAKILEWLLYQDNISFILGNHEAMMLSCKRLFCEITEESISELEGDIDSSLPELMSVWLNNGGSETVRGLSSLGKDTVLAIVEYLEDAPLYETVRVGGKKYILTHSGLGNFSPERRIEDYSANDLLWNRPSPFDRYYDDAITVFGHTPTGYLEYGSGGKIIVTDTWIDIDTGASSGRHPTLLRLDDMQSFEI